MRSVPLPCQAARSVHGGHSGARRQELLAEGIDPDEAARVDNQGEEDEEAEIKETGHIDPEVIANRRWQGVLVRLSDASINSNQR